MPYPVIDFFLKPHAGGCHLTKPVKASHITSQNQNKMCLHLHIK